jgi:hypothetical protein
MAKRAYISKLIVMVCTLFFWSCAQQRPVLYPNPYLQNVGNEKAQADIDECMRLADQYGAKEDVGGKIAKDTATGAAVGAAAGAAIGAVLGKNVGRAAGAGAAGAGAGALTHSAIRSGEADPLFRRYVEKCLQEKGYETIGWR